MKLFIGLMSGTSMDGIDAALVESESQQCILGITVPYSESLKSDIKSVVSGKRYTAAWLNQLHTRVGQAFGEAACTLMDETRVTPAEITAIGSHGQTVCHDASHVTPYTVQYGCPHSIAEIAGIQVVADFRTRDLIAGGQGAPLAPLYHHELFKHEKWPLAVVNIGGIANLSILTKHNDFYGFDTGPGNVLMDIWIEQHTGMEYDKNGRWSATGIVDEKLLSSLLNDPYFSLQPPRSAGREYFSLDWLKRYGVNQSSPENIQATLRELTAESIADSIRNLPEKPLKAYICGGGAHNIILMQSLQKRLPNVQVASVSESGLSPDFMEAGMFAWLAEKALNKDTFSLHKITGSRKPVILGVVYPFV